MLPPAFSVSRLGTQLRAVPFIVLGLFAVRGVAEEVGLGDPSIGLKAAEIPNVHGMWAAPFVDSQAWTPPAALAQEVRTAVADRWRIAADSVHIEWQEPPRPVASDATMERLLGPGRAGSWIVLIESETRASIRFRAGVPVRAAVARLDLPRGRKLLDEDIEWAETIVWGPPRATTHVASVGWITRRPIASGEPLMGSAVSRAPAVRSGDAVIARWTGGKVTIDVPGEVVGEAALGETVLVRLTTGLRVEGVVADAGTVLFPVAESDNRVPSTRPRN